MIRDPDTFPGYQSNNRVQAAIPFAVAGEAVCYLLQSHALRLAGLREPRDALSPETPSLTSAEEGHLQQI